MPEQRLERMRKTLPEGYQFGDAGKGDEYLQLAIDMNRKLCVGLSRLELYALAENLRRGVVAP